MSLAYTDVAESAVARRARPIARVRDVSREAFAAAHLGPSAVPVIVTDAVERWPARDWTIEGFAARFARDPVVANSPFFHDEIDGLQPVQLRTSLADYARYVLDPSREPAGAWSQGSWAALQGNGVPLYAPGYRVLALHPELERELPPSPYFADDLLRQLPPHLVHLLDRLPSPVHYLFFAPRGAVAFLHHDYWDSHAYLAQLQGRKFCLLFGPEDAERLEGVKDPVIRDAGHSGLAEATPWSGWLEKGDLIFVPARWKHFVVTIEPSLTFSYDFFTRDNMGRYLSHFFMALARFLAEDQDPIVLAQARALLRAALAEAGKGDTRAAGPARS